MQIPVLLVFLIGCGEKDTDTAPIDTGSDTADTIVDTADTADSDTDPCADVPVVTYNNFGEGFMTENCQGCHASTTADRYGAPESVIFDTVDDVWSRAERILERAAGDDASMPPAGGVSEDDRTKLEWWLICAEEGT